MEILNFTRNASKSTIYEEIIPQIEALIAGEDDLIANLANVSAVLKESLGFFWVGFYLVKNEVLILGPFQGLLACTKIQYGKGVCGKAWSESRSIVVPDVDAFPGHIACSSLSRSEIVLPIYKDNKVVAVLDVDSEKLNDFDEIDERELNKIVRLIEEKL
ncbi:MAG: GAF domain-containing protein [Bacteroidales bacterium]